MSVASAPVEVRGRQGWDSDESGRVVLADGRRIQLSYTPGCRCRFCRAERRQLRRARRQSR